MSIATPLSWQIVGALLLGCLLVTVAFLATGSYARVETASGAVSLDTGVASIMATRAGVIRSLMVGEGQYVRAGSPLVAIRSEEDMIGGSTAPSRVSAALREQDRRLVAENVSTLKAARADASRLRAQVEGARSELGSLAGQAQDQERLVAAAGAEYEEVKKVAAAGFISRRDLESREATLLARRQQLSQLQQLAAAKRTTLLESERMIAQSGASADAQIANTESSRAGLVQQIAQADLARGYVLRAPLDGVVTAVTARVGLPAAVDQPLLMIVPKHARTRAELSVPTAAAGFLAVGQPVRLAIDAFPYDRFGTVVGRISTISNVAVAKNGPAGAVPVYMVTADLAAASVRAFGRNQPLLPGMTLSARITTEKRTLLQWLFEPIFAVRNR